MEATRMEKRVDWRGKVWLALFIVTVVVVCLVAAWLLAGIFWHNCCQKPEVILKASLENPRLDFYAAGEGEETVIVFTTGEKTIRVYAVRMNWFYNLEDTETEYLTGKWNGWPDNFYDDYVLHLHRSRSR